jgi:hypothetical protein
MQLPYRRRVNAGGKGVYQESGESSSGFFWARGGFGQGVW